MRSRFPLFQSHLDFAHQQWHKIVVSGDVVIDATCGNGKDTLKLSQLALDGVLGKVYAIDIQEKAILETKKHLACALSQQDFDRITFIHGSHSAFPTEIQPKSVKLIVYNLGYLPGGDKSQTTQFESTLMSFQAALPLIVTGGVISITSYPGHEEGLKEQTMFLEYLNSFSNHAWSVSFHTWINRKLSPSVILVQKSDSALLHM